MAPSLVRQPVTWMSQLHSQNIFQAGRFFNRRSIYEARLEDDANSPVSYGINGKSHEQQLGTSADKIAKPSGLSLRSCASIRGQSSLQPNGDCQLAAPGVPAYKAASSARRLLTDGTHSSRTKINALFADLHLENMPWQAVVHKRHANPFAVIRRASRWSRKHLP